MNVSKLLESNKVIRLDTGANGEANIFDTKTNQYYTVAPAEYTFLFDAVNLDRSDRLLEIGLSGPSALTIECELNTNGEMHIQELIEKSYEIVSKHVLVSPEFKTVYFVIDATPRDSLSTVPKDRITHCYLIVPSILLESKVRRWIVNLHKELLEGVIVSNEYRKFPIYYTSENKKHLYQISAKSGRAYKYEIEVSNLELSLNYPQSTPHIHRVRTGVREEYIPQIIEIEASYQEEENDIEFTRQLESIGADPVLKFFRDILSIINHSRLEEITHALLRGGTIYDDESRVSGFRTLTQYYLRRVVPGYKYRQHEFEALISDAHNSIYHVSKIYIVIIARITNKYHFDRAVDDLCHGYLTHYALNRSGGMESGVIAHLLYFKFGYKYMVNNADVGVMSAGGQWYRFNEENDNYNPGYIARWQLSKDLSSLKVSVENLGVYFHRAIATLNGHPRVKDLIKAENKLQKYNFMIETLKHLELYCANTEFLRKLDMYPEVIGVGNGVLSLHGTEPFLCSTVHNIPISRTTGTNWHPYNPTDPAQIKLWSILTGIIPEEDALHKILLYFASCLKNGEQDPAILLFDGGGENGKTTFIEIFFFCLMNDLTDPNRYCYSPPMSVFTESHGASGAPNAALAALKGALFCKIEEILKGAVLNDMALKLLIDGIISTSAKYKDQVNFRVFCRYVLATNNLLIIKSNDHGTWRRIFRYICSQWFTDNPNPEKPNERKIDRSINKVWIRSRECREAAQSLLVHYYFILKNKYHGNIHEVPSPTIEKHTLDYRMTQDTVGRFIRECMLVTPPTSAPPASASQPLPPTSAPPMSTSPPTSDLEPTVELVDVELFRVNLADIVTAYIEWYRSHIGKQTAPEPSHVFSEFQTSSLKKYLRVNPDQIGSYYVRNCRPISLSVGPYYAHQKGDREIPFQG